MSQKHFLDDKEKMKDFHSLSKEEFLAFYSYISKEEYDYTTQMERCRIFKCPVCEDRDCSYNVDSKCHKISVITSEVPSGMFTCRDNKIEFNRKEK